MADGKIHLKAQEFNRWMEAMGEEITRAKDKLALLSEEERRLSEIWESGAGKEWGLELQRVLRQAADCVAQMEALTGKVKERAKALTEMEKIMKQAVEGL